jgi:hypothetical protein
MRLLAQIFFLADVQGHGISVIFILLPVGIITQPDPPPHGPF